MAQPKTNLQRERIKKGISQKELAKASGIAVKSIQNYEQHHRSIDGAKLETLCDLSIALDCGIDDIIENEKLKIKYKEMMEAQE